MAKRRSDCNPRLRVVVRLCSCSPAKEAEYLTTHRYCRPRTSNFSAPARTPGCALLQEGSWSSARPRNSPGVSRRARMPGEAFDIRGSEEWKEHQMRC